MIDPRAEKRSSDGSGRRAGRARRGGSAGRAGRPTGARPSRARTTRRSPARPGRSRPARGSDGGGGAPSGSFGGNLRRHHRPSRVRALPTGSLTVPATAARCADRRRLRSRLSRSTAAAASRSARRRARSLLIPARPQEPRVATQVASRCAPASPDFSGWNWVATSGPFSTAATNGSPCVAQVTSGVRSVSLVGRSSQRRTRVGVHEVEALVLDARRTARAARAPRRCSTPCAAARARAAARPSPGHSPQPCGVDAVLDAVLEQHLHADADAEHRAAAGEPAADRSRGPCTARSPAMHAANAPTPGTTRPSRSSAASRSAVTVTSAPARASARSADRRLPEP